MTGVALPVFDFLQVAGERIPQLHGVKFTHGDLMDYQRCLAVAGGALLDADVPLAHVFQIAGAAILLAGLLLFFVRRTAIAPSLADDAGGRERPRTHRVRPVESRGARA